ncbi:MAG: hypothetical protein GYB53_20305 [Rhodobacteraceae bacterium]|nr:hypothetical protein [Paracoccaceae bacterium]MBR9823791.1 hypothetical protein [Paracoccaceae bacterium]
MHDLNTLESLRTFAQLNLKALETLLSNRDSTITDERLQDWLSACALRPQTALQRDTLEAVVIDLVTLELSCQAYAETTNGLLLTDRGGTVWARRVQAELLLLLNRWEPRIARKLATLACNSRRDRLNQIRTLIVERR